MDLNLDGWRIQSEEDLHAAVAEASGIEWYGRNLDALDEFVGWSLDAPIHIRWVNAQASKNAIPRFDLIVEILRDAADDRGPGEYSFVLEM